MPGYGARATEQTQGGDTCRIDGYVKVVVLHGNICTGNRAALAGAGVVPASGALYGVPTYLRYLVDTGADVWTGRRRPIQGGGMDSGIIPEDI